MSPCFRLPLIAAFLLIPSAIVSAEQIVVTGKKLADTEAELNACLERKCPPDQDVAASLAHAENQFISGDYKGSRSTLLRSIGRNREHGKAYPVPVSDLFRANGRIAEHVGESRNFQLSVLDMRNTLKKGLGEDDFRTLVAQIEVGDSRAKLGFPDESERIYRDVETRALRLGQNRVATLARLRQALLIKARYDDTPNSFLRDRLNAKLDQVIGQPLPGAEEFALAAEVIRAKIDRSAGAAATTDALVKRFAEQGGATQPLLLYSEPLEQVDLSKGWADGMPSQNALSQLTALSARGQWADVGFWIGPDGRVTDVEVLRKSGEQRWIKPVIGNIGKRVYAPLKRAGAEAVSGFYMIERYTLTARFADDVTGTNLRRREAMPRIERLDITPENFEPPEKNG